jgi:predicted amidophosphoribosyltransferase
MYPPSFGWSMGLYRPYRIQGVRNPKFDRHSGFILDIKEKSATHKRQAAVNHFADLIVSHMKTLPMQGQTEILVVPSSTKGQWSPGLELVAQAVAKKDKRFSFVAKALIRTRTIDKLASGGDRSLAVHLDSLQYDWDLASTLPKFLIDDVTTTGNSFAGCMTVIQSLFRQPVQITPLVLGKTSHD